MIVDDYIAPSVLTGFVREVPVPYTLILNQILPDRRVGDIEAALDMVTRVNRVAQFRAWDAETSIGQRDTFQRSRVKLPPIGIKTPIGEMERLMLERLRTGGDNRNAYVDAIYDDAANNTRAVLNRMELARGDVLVDGRFTLAGEGGLTLEADFGLAPSHNVTAGVLWSDHTNSTPLTDLRTWVNQLVDELGYAPGRLITSNTVVRNLLLSAEIRALFFRGQNALTGSPDIITMDQLNTVFQAYGLPPVQEYNTQLEVNGVFQRVIPNNKLIMVPADGSQLGWTAWGVTAEALEIASSGGLGDDATMQFQDLPGLVGVVMKEGDPLRIWTKVGAVGMPMITDPRQLFVATVL